MIGVEIIKKGTGKADCERAELMGNGKANDFNFSICKGTVFLQHFSLISLSTNSFLILPFQCRTREPVSSSYKVFLFKLSASSDHRNGYAMVLCVCGSGCWMWMDGGR